MSDYIVKTLKIKEDEKLVNKEMIEWTINQNNFSMSIRKLIIEYIKLNGTKDIFS